jgi:hypothetical protein
MRNSTSVLRPNGSPIILRSQSVHEKRERKQGLVSGACSQNGLLQGRSLHCKTAAEQRTSRMVRNRTPADLSKKGDYVMSTKTKLALALALVLSTSSAVLAAPRHSAAPAHVSAAEQAWFDRASAPDTGGSN